MTYKKEAGGDSWVNFDKELLLLWNYFADKEHLVTNTRQLFQLAARPHFNFFIEMINNFVIDENIDISDIQDSQYRDFILKTKKVARKKDELREKIKSAQAPILIAYKGQKFSGLEKVPRIELDRADLFGNVEPGWRRIRMYLNRKTFSSILVGVGPERAMIIPRAAQVYQIPVYDVSSLALPSFSHTNSFGARIARRLKKILGIK